MATIGWIGLGNMGRPMTKNLIAAGHTVRGFDLDERAVAAAAENGVEAVGSIAQAVDGAEVVFTMLPKGEHARSVYLDEGGVLEFAAPGTLLVDSSTIDVDSANALHDAAEKAGFSFVDAPVSGGISGAAAGTLTFMLGGADADVERARTFVEPMAGNVFHAGGNGAGQAAKIVNNMMLAISLQGAAEGAVLARKLGLDAQTFWDIAHVSSGDSWPLRTWYPYPGVVDSSPANNDFAPTFTADLANKDIKLALAAAEETDTPLVLGTIVQEMLQQVSDAGAGGRDCSIVKKIVDGTFPS